MIKTNLLRILVLNFLFSSCVCEAEELTIPPVTKNKPLVKSITFLKDNVGKPDWSPKSNEFIAYHTREKDGYYDIHIMKADGSQDQCLTCNHPKLPNRHIGEPSWHPFEKWIVFQAEKRNHIFSRIGRGLAAPGIGFHNDIWIMSLDTREVFQLTNLKTKARLLDGIPITGILGPHFSPDGKLLSWSERVDSGGKWGRWVIRVADFETHKGIPRVKNIRTFKPGVNQIYYESNDFMPDNKTLLICGNLEPGQDELGIDIYLLDLKTGHTTRLTHSVDKFDECPHPSLDGSKIAFLSTRDFEFKKMFGGGGWWRWAKGEFWIMNADGSNVQQLTHFNEPGYSEYSGKRVIPANLSWNNEGNKILLGIAIEYKGKRLKDQLYLVELNK